MNTCDFDHEGNFQTRLLPYGGGGNIIVCKRHYQREINSRVEWAKVQRMQPVTIYLPAWETLKIYQPEDYTSEVQND